MDIDKIEKGLENIERQKPTEDFLLKMEDQVLKFRPENLRISKLQLFAIAASLALLLIANYYGYRMSQDDVLISEGYNLIPTKTLYNG